MFFDDGFHCPISAHPKCNVAEILNLIHKPTSSDNFHPAKWSQIKRCKVPMPNQPDCSSASKTGCGSCGVAVICTIRDICKGITNVFTRNYKVCTVPKSGVNVGTPRSSHRFLMINKFLLAVCLFVLPLRHPWK